MSSSKVVPLDTSNINGGYPIFSSGEFRRVANNVNAAAAYESYKTWDVKFRKTEEREIRKEWKTRPESSTCASQEAMNTEWTRIEENFQASIEQRELCNLSTPLDNATTFKPTINVILVLGLGSLSKTSDRIKSMRQHYFTFQLIRRYVNKLQLGYNIKKHNGPKVFVDCTHYNLQDYGFAKKKFAYTEVMNVNFLPLSTILKILSPDTSTSIFLIIYKPDNPIRQMVADLVLPEDSDDPGDHKIPPLIICAPSDIETLPSDPEHWSGDETSDRVQRLLKEYEPFGFESDEWKKKGVDPFGHIHLWMPKHLSQGIGTSDTDTDPSLPKDEQDDLDDTLLPGSWAPPQSPGDWERIFEEAKVLEDSHWGAENFPEMVN